MKKTLFALLLTAVVLTAAAIPAKRGLWRTITLADGTQVEAELRGNEYGCAWFDAAGNCYREIDGAFEAVDVETVVAAAASQHAKRQAARRAARRRILATSTDDGLGTIGQSAKGGLPSIGTPTIPVIMVNFSDTTFQPTTTVERMSRFYNEEGFTDESLTSQGYTLRGSVRDYFKAQSGGRFVPTFDVVGIVTLNHPYAYYGQNSDYVIDVNIDSLPKHAVLAAQQQLGIDFSKYEIDGAVPLVAVLYAGGGEATYAGDDTVWPCQNDCYTYYGPTFFNSWFVGNELDRASSNSESASSAEPPLMGMGVFCHEAGHALGLPDFYDTRGTYSRDDAFGSWSIMDYGAYVNGAYAPIGYTAYERSYLGWLDIAELDTTDRSSHTLVPFGEDGDHAMLLRHPSDPTQYFILECRAPGTWYPDSYGQGILVTRFAYDAQAWKANTVEVEQYAKRAMAVTANGQRLADDAEPNDLFGNSNTFKASWNFHDGTNLPFAILDVTPADDGTVTFTAVPADRFALYETFDGCSGNGANDGRWYGNLAKGTVETDLSGWTITEGYGALHAVRLGKKSVQGSATSPAFSGEGNMTVYFHAGAGNSSNDSTRLSVATTAGTLGNVSPLAHSAWTSQAVALTLNGKATPSLTFATPSGNFFIDDVLVITDSLTAVSSPIADVHAATPSPVIYNLSGQAVGTSLRALPAGIYIRNGRKIVVAP